MFDVSILIAVHNRADLLRRNLWTLTRQTTPCEIVVVDDGSTEDVEGVAKSAGVEYYRMREPSPPGHPNLRGPNLAWWHGFRRCKGSFIILSHPEILVPLNGVEVMLQEHTPKLRSVPILYFLSKSIQDQIDSVDWKDDVHLIKSLPEFGGVMSHWGYYNHEAPNWRHHVCFTGMLKEDWEAQGFLPEVAEFGNDDSWLHIYERSIGRKINKVALEVYHQFHGLTKVHGRPSADWLEQNPGGSTEVGASARLRRIQHGS